MFRLLQRIEFGGIQTILPFLGKLKIRGITIFPFIIYANDYVLLNRRIESHERTHLLQQYECTVTGLIVYFVTGLIFNIWTWSVIFLFSFYILYAMFYLIARITYNHNMAYMMIPFEREAYRNESITNYWKSRKPFTWTKFIM